MRIIDTSKYIISNNPNIYFIVKKVKYMLKLLQKLSENIDVLKNLLKNHNYRSLTCVVYAQGSGRFGNIMLRNLACYVLSKKFNCRVIYEKMENIGIHLISTPKTQKVGKEIKLNDADVFNVFQNRLQLKDNHLYHIHRYCQSPEIVGEIICEILNSELLDNYKKYIESKYSDFYTNNDIFIHYRAIDKENRKLHALPNAETMLEVIDYIIKTKNVSNIYLSYDRKNDVINQILKVHKKIIDFSKKSITETINFGSSRKYVLVSSGSFSFTIGLLAYINSSKIFVYSKSGIGWHPPFFKKLCEYDSERYVDYDQI